MDNKKIKILQVTTIDVTIYSFLIPHLQILKNNNYEVDIACRPTKFRKEIENAKFKVFPVSFNRKFYSPSNIKAFFQILKLLKKEKYQIVHTHTPVASFITRIAAKIARIPIVIYTVHGFHFHEFGNPSTNTIYYLLEKFAGQFMNAIITINQEDYKTAKKMFKKKRVFKLPGIGINTRKYQPLEKNSTQAIKRDLNIKTDEKVIGMIAEFNPGKRHIDLINAAKIVIKKYPQTKFILVGIGSLKNHFEKLVKKLNISQNFIFTGFSEDIANLLSIINLFVLPSHREGMPRSILEAMASNKPVIATNIRGCREEVVDGETGLLFPIKNPEALADAIIKILSNPELAKKMGQAGRKRVIENFDEKMVLEKELKIYQELINKKL